MTPTQKILIKYTVDGKPGPEHVTEDANLIREKVKIRLKHYGHIVRFLGVERKDS